MNMTKPSIAQIEELRTAVDTIVRIFKIVDDVPIADGLKLNPTDVQALLFIHRNNLCIASQLADFLGVVPTTNSAVIDRLVKRELVVRNRTESNRRIVQLSLTNNGHKAADAIIEEQSSHCSQMLDLLGPEERSHFVRSMTKIATGLT